MHEYRRLIRAGFALCAAAAFDPDRSIASENRDAHRAILLAQAAEPAPGTEQKKQEPKAPAQPPAARPPTAAPPPAGAPPGPKQAPHQPSAPPAPAPHHKQTPPPA